MIFLKNQQKGFLLIEAIVVITFVAGILFFLFIQFNTLFQQYGKDFNYNTVDGVYRAKELRTFLLNTDFSDLIFELQDNQIFYEFSDCTFANDISLCNHFIEALDIKKSYMVNEDITGFQTYVKNAPASENFGELAAYLFYIQYDRNNPGYRLIIEFTDGSFASINFL